MFDSIRSLWPCIRSVGLLIPLGVLGVVGFIGVNGASHADDRRIVAVPSNSVPFELTKNSVLRGWPLKIGDLSVVGGLETGAPGSESWEESGEVGLCVQYGPEWLSYSTDGHLQLNSPWGSTQRDEILTAYCEEDLILLGGVRRAADGEGRTYGWIFLMDDAYARSPVKIVFKPSYTVGPWPQGTRYELNGVQSIDPVSGRIFFAGTDENGKKVLLSARFAIVGGAEAD